MSNGNGVTPGTVIEAAPPAEPPVGKTADKTPDKAKKRPARAPTPRHRPSKADAASPAPAPAPKPPAPEPPAPSVEPAPAPTPTPAQVRAGNVWFQPLPPMEPDEGPWETIPSTLCYSSEANLFRTASGLVVAEVEWGGGIIAFMMLPREPMRVRLHDGSLFDVPPHQAFVAIPAVAELAAVMAKFREDPEHCLAVRFKPISIKLLEDGRPTVHFEVQVMKTPIKRADALVLKAA